MSIRHPAYGSHFYMDGEIAFADGDAIDRNPYEDGEACEAWRAGWLHASRSSWTAGSALGVIHTATSDILSMVEQPG